ncbi:MAG: PIN/TRAM domain-containing protein [Anaerolineae bacterium]
MRIEFIIRILVMVVFAFLAAGLGVSVADYLGLSAPQGQAATLLFMLAGALIGLLTAPWLTVRPALAVRRRIERLPSHVLIASVIGLLLGLVMSALLAVPLSFLPSPLNALLPILATLFICYFITFIFSSRAREALELLVVGRRGSGSPDLSTQLGAGRRVLMDTSVIIDGRIADIARLGFVGGTLVVPRFILAELQHIADSSDALRRNRGRRGLEILNRMQQDSSSPVLIVDDDIEGVREADDKLVLLAKQYRAPIMTNDYNLNRVAELQGITVLNINELANAVKAVFLPGEEMTIRVLQEGKEVNQGVGYLDDGTMVVIEEGKRYIDRTIEVVVTKHIQTPAGRMIFARPADLMDSQNRT